MFQAGAPVRGDDDEIEGSGQLADLIARRAVQDDVLAGNIVGNSARAEFFDIASGVLQQAFLVDDKTEMCDVRRGGGWHDMDERQRCLHFLGDTDGVRQSARDASEKSVGISTFFQVMVGVRLPILLCCLAHDQHRTGRMANYALSSASHEHVLPAGIAMSRDDNQVAV